MKDYKDPGKLKRSVYMTYKTYDMLTAASIFFENVKVGEGHRTMSDIMEAGVLLELTRLQKKYHGNKQFKYPKGLPLRRGFVRGAKKKEEKQPCTQHSKNG